MIDFTLPEILTGLDLSEVPDAIVVRSAGRLVLTGEPLEPDASFRQRVAAIDDDPAAQVANAYELDAIGMKHGLIRDGYRYEATEISAEKPE